MIGINGKENTVDDRGNIFKSFRFKAMVVLMILLISAGFMVFNSFLIWEKQIKDKTSVKADSSTEMAENSPLEKHFVQPVVNYTR